MQEIRLNLINFNNRTKNHNLIPYLFKLTARFKIKSQFKKCNDELYVSIKGNPEILGSLITDIKSESEFSEKSNNNLEHLKDKGPCLHCINEVFDPENRRYKYHLTSCNNCGQKTSFIKELPFKREKTMLEGFFPCEKCISDMNSNNRYKNYPLTVCPKCGPQLKILDRESREIISKDVISKIAQLINKGEILALKTYYGYKLIASAYNNAAIKSFVKKTKNYSSIGLVFFSIDDIKRLFEVDNKVEIKKLNEHKTVILKAKLRSKLINYSGNERLFLSCKIAPSLLHALIISHLEEPFFIECNTSSCGESPLFDDKLAIKVLKNDIKYFITDSISPAVLSQPEVYKKTQGTGFVKTPSINHFNVCTNIPMISLGYEENPSISVTSGDKIAYLPLPGKLSSFQSLKLYKDNYDWLKKIHKIKPVVVAFSPRPNSKMGKFAQKESARITRVQHHHAHAVSVMIENDLKKDVIAAVYDIGGYADGNCLIGAEYLIVNRNKYKRIAFFEEYLLPGNRICLDEPWRIAFSLLHKAYGNNFFPYPQLFKDVSQRELGMLKEMLDNKIDCQVTNSMSLLTMGLISIAGLANKNNYDNESFELFSHFDNFGDMAYNRFNVLLKRSSEIKITPLIKYIYEKTFAKSTSEILELIRQTITEISVKTLIGLSKKYKIKNVVLTGDFFEEGLIIDKLRYLLEKKGLKCYTNKKLPLNDYNLSVGQIAVAAKKSDRPTAA